MPDVGDTKTGAVRQFWRAALAVLGVVVLEQIAFLTTPSGSTPADWLFDLAFAAAGLATTRLMLQSAEGGGRRLVDVWAAAIRWGLPALMTVVVTVLVVSVALLPPADLKNQAWTALWTMLGASGGELMKQGPFDPAMSSELLLHLWATGVAVQLFVGWTVVVAVMIRLRLTHRIRALVLLGMLLSLGLEVWMRGRGLHPQAFYLAPANAWPFLLGAAFAGFPPTLERFEIRWRSRLGRLGDLAWPFCLWLWPLAILPRMILARPLTPWEWAAVLVAAGLLAFATHRWIETPVRRRLGYRPRTAFAFAAVCIAIVAFVSAALFASDGLPGRADARLLAEAAAVLQRAPLQGVCHVEEGRATPPSAACTTPPGGPAEVVVWGNSHAAGLTPAVLNWTMGRGLRMRQVTRSGCLPLLVDAGDLASPDCLAFNRAAVREMGEGPRPRLVIVGAAWTVILGRSPGSEASSLKPALAETVRRLRAAVGPQAHIVLLEDTPDFAFAPAACHARRRFLGLDTGRCDLAAPANASDARDMHDVLTEIAAGQPGVRLFDPSAGLCRYGRCRTRDADGPWYVDGHHLTPAGGRARSESLAAVLDAAWTRP